MTNEELRKVLATIKQGLETNQQIVQQPLIDTLRKFVTELRFHPSTQEVVGRVGAAGEYDIDKLLIGLSNAINIEEKLIGEEGNILIKLCEGIRSRPMLLGILARFI
jgi:hypothetical protein